MTNIVAPEPEALPGWTEDIIDLASPRLRIFGRRA